MKSLIKLTIVFIFLLPSLVAAETITYYCDYTKHGDEKGHYKVNKKFAFTIIVDKITGDAYLHGNGGISELIFFKSKDKSSFLEVTKTSNLMITTIDSKLNSVHSRNSVMFGELIPSQYYGKCIIK